MSGLGDALAKEGRNMQKGLQDAHDIWMGQRPVPQTEVHEWGNWEAMGGEKSEEQPFGPDDKTVAAADTAVNNEPPEFGPAIDGPEPYNPPIGPDPVQNQEPGVGL